MAMKRSTVVFALVLAFSALVFAQEHKAPAPPSEPQASVEPQKPADHAASQPSAQPGHAKASKEASEEDESAQFRQSPSVHFLARITGLSLTAAYWVSTIANFAVIAILIFWGLKKALPGMFRDRTAMIQKAMEEARKASEEANRRLGDIEGRLARLDQEIAGLRSGAEEEARQEEERIRAAAEEDRQKVVHTAEQEIAAAARGARTELKAYAAELAVSLAERKIRVNAGEDRELVRTFADQLRKDGK